jgi:hypothetical protein
MQNQSQPSLQGLGCNSCRKTPMAYCLGRMGDDPTDASAVDSSSSNGTLLLVIGALGFFALIAGSAAGRGGKKVYRRTRRAISSF